jgi:hypothetical protein
MLSFDALEIASLPLRFAQGGERSEPESRSYLIHGVRGIVVFSGEFSIAIFSSPV